MSLSFHNPVKIMKAESLVPVIDDHITENTILVISKSAFKRYFEQYKNKLPANLLVLSEFEANPSLSSILKMREQINYSLYNKVLAVGGGSALDTAKCLAVKETDQIFLDILQGKDQRIPQTLDLIAVPTTAGTGSEVTPWATVWDFDNDRKLSFMSQNSWPIECYCIPQLTLTKNKDLTIQTGLDALSHSLESLWNVNRNFVSAKLAISASKEIRQVLPLLINDLDNLKLRKRMIEASTLAGLAFSNTKTATAHALSYQFTLENELPHGIACSFTLPAIVSSIFKDDSTQLKEVRQNLIDIWGENPTESIKSFFSTLNVSTRYSNFGITRDKLLENFDKVSSNPRGKNGLANLSTLKEIMLDESIS